MPRNAAFSYGRYEESSMRYFKIKGDYITLGQLLKATDIAQDGADAKYMILNGEASVNGETETRRGRKLYDGDVVSCGKETVQVKQ